MYGYDVYSIEALYLKHSFLKLDIKKCFDNIDIKEIIVYVKELFASRVGRENVFTLLKYCSIQSDIDDKHLKHRYDCLTLKHHKHDKGFLHGIADLIDILEKEACAKKPDSTWEVCKNVDSKLNIVVVPMSIHERNVDIGKLMRQLRMSLEHVMINIHNDLYERMNGILQGMLTIEIYSWALSMRKFYYGISGTLLW